MAEPCVRCGRSGLNVGGLFPDGRLCASCYRTAIRTRGRCADCGLERLIPGRNDKHEPVCVDCAGINKPIPSAVEAIFAELASSDQNRRLHNHDSPWLFPGRRTGTHLSSAWAREGLKPIIGDILAARNSALRQLVTDCPAPIVADMVGYQHKVTTRHAAQAGSPWLTYAASRSQ